MLIPVDGGIPVNAFPGKFADDRVQLTDFDPARGIAYFMAESNLKPVMTSYQADLKARKLVKLATGTFGYFPVAASKNHDKVALIEPYTTGDQSLYLWSVADKKLNLLYGKPINKRKPGEVVPLNGVSNCTFVNRDKGLLLTTTIFDDTGTPGYLDIAQPQEIAPVKVAGIKHRGTGEIERMKHLHDDRFALSYNIDGESWAYEGSFDQAAMSIRLDRVIAGRGPTAAGSLDALAYDKSSDVIAFGFSTATSPSQIFTADGDARKLAMHTRERIVGIPSEWLSAGEDASFTSFDGLRVSARLYLPAKALGFKEPRPLVYYVHGGPQGQERPDFTWFSMPLIQFLTMKGFAVFVPNVRGSTGYGLAYTKHVDHDWGGQDRLDHVHAMTKVLSKDKRIDVKRAGVTGRSYGGYMTLMLAARHPELWSAAVEMFGPYDLVTFSERIPETWKPYFAQVLGDPTKPEDRKFLKERSPSTYMNNVTAPMLVIQGHHDPRVVEAESRDVVKRLQKLGKQAEILVFEDEGHDVLKFANRVTCYNAITDFFVKYLKP
jgi:dipeptidyl aminopeptidase/acylaminoacyl peptidase